MSILELNREEEARIDEIDTLKTANRQLQIDLLSERLLRLNFQMQLLKLMQDETQKTLQDLQESANTATPS